jgi:hypothetical protein
MRVDTAQEPIPASTALGRESIESALTPDALSRLCGLTLHDWNDVHSGRP